MLIKPSIDSLLEKVENKYALVVLSAARARQIREALLAIDPDEVSEEDIKLLKEVSIALEEIDSGKVDFDFIEDYARKIYQEQKESESLESTDEDSEESDDKEDTKE